MNSRRTVPYSTLATAILLIVFSTVSSGCDSNGSGSTDGNLASEIIGPWSNSRMRSDIVVTVNTAQNILNPLQPAQGEITVTGRDSYGPYTEQLHYLSYFNPWPIERTLSTSRLVASNFPASINFVPRDVKHYLVIAGNAESGDFVLSYRHSDVKSSLGNTGGQMEMDLSTALFSFNDASFEGFKADGTLRGTMQSVPAGGSAVVHRDSVFLTLKAAGPAGTALDLTENGYFEANSGIDRVHGTWSLNGDQIHFSQDLSHYGLLLQEGTVTIDSDTLIFSGTADYCAIYDYLYQDRAECTANIESGYGIEPGTVTRIEEQRYTKLIRVKPLGEIE